MHLPVSEGIITTKNYIYFLMKLNKQILTILIIQITEVLGFSLVLPFLPLYVQELGASPFMVGLLLMSFSLFQFISAPIMGKLSDIYGRRPLLILSQISTFFGFIILGLANTIWLVFLSRIVDGALGSNFTIAQAYLSDISTKKDRSKAFGISGVAFGVGFLIGPAIGGYLAQFGYWIPAFLAAGMSFVTIVLTFFLLPETVQKPDDYEFNIQEMFHIKEFIQFFSKTKTAYKLWEFFFYLLMQAILVSSFALYAEKQLGFTTKHVGYSLAFIGLVNIILRGFLIPKLIDIFGEGKLQFGGILFTFVGLFMISFIQSWFLFEIAIVLFSVGTGVARPIYMGEVSRSVPDTKQGSILGVTSSLQSISQIAGPLIGGFCIQYFFAGSIGLVSSGILSISIFLLLWEKRKRVQTILGA